MYETKTTVFLNVRKHLPKPLDEKGRCFLCVEKVRIKWVLSWQIQFFIREGAVDLFDKTVSQNIRNISFMDEPIRFAKINIDHPQLF